MADAEVKRALRYVSSRQRRRKDGSLSPARWYWNRPGFKLASLPADPITRLAKAKALNDAADAGAASVPVEGTVAWFCRLYRDSRLAKKAASTQEAYGRWLREIEDTLGRLPVSGLTRRAVMAWVDGLPEAPSTRRHAVVVMQGIVKLAHDRGHLATNTAAAIEVGSAPRRDQVWTDEQIAAVLDACPSPGYRLAYTLLIYTGQRPSDVCAMTWGRYDGDVIRVRQIKTGALIDVPVHRDLRQALDAARTAGTVTRLPTADARICLHRGRKLTTGALGDWFRRHRGKLGCGDVLNRDLRRTAVLKLALAGCTIPQIVSVTGHSLQGAARILATYLPRNTELARQAIALLEARK